MGSGWATCKRDQDTVRTPVQNVSLKLIYRVYRELLCHTEKERQRKSGKAGKYVECYRERIAGIRSAARHC